jgi:hypothetical protein
MIALLLPGSVCSVLLENAVATARWVFAPNIECIDLHNLVYRTEINGYADRKLEGSSQPTPPEEGL